MNIRSIRVRLAAWYALILMAMFAVAGGSAWWLMRNGIHESVDEELTEHLEAVRSSVVDARSGGPAGLATLADRLALQYPPSAEVRVRVGQGPRWVHSSAGRWPIASPESGLPGVQTAVVNGRATRVARARAVIDGDTWTFEAARSVGDFYRALDRLAWAMALLAPIALIVASAGGYWMSTRALAPVDHITHLARGIGATTLGARLPQRGTDDELARLTETLNAMFARLDASFRRITQFTADASHELRTPTAIIRTTAEVTRRRPRSEDEYVAALDRILRESERMSELIDDLLLLARSDSGADAPVLEPVDLAALVRSACDQVHVLAHDAGIAFAHTLPESCEGSGDPDALRRLLLTLLDNAVKYTPPGGHILVAMSTDGGQAEVAVQDSGIGISTEALPHIFERFYRVDTARGRSRGGSGLGLAIARTIARAHGGDVTVTSELGRGSRFVIRLPLHGAVPRPDPLRFVL